MWSRIRIREMHGEDRHALRAVFDGMSPTSRQRRFHRPMTVNDAVQRLLRRQPAAVRVQDRGATRQVRGQLDGTVTVEDVLVDLGRSGWFPMR